MADFSAMTSDFFGGILADTSDLVQSWAHQELGKKLDLNQPVDAGGHEAGKPAPVQAKEDTASFFSTFTTAELVKGGAILAGFLVVSGLAIRWALKS